MIDNGMLNRIENLLTWTAKRQQAMAANVANLDTPGYRAKDYAFEQELESMNLAATSDQHLEIENGSNVRMYEVNTNVKPDGNSVDLERELTEITKNGLQYVTLIQYLNQKLRTLRSSISEGGKV